MCQIIFLRLYKGVPSPKKSMHVCVCASVRLCSCVCVFGTFWNDIMARMLALFCNNRCSCASAWRSQSSCSSSVALRNFAISCCSRWCFRRPIGSGDLDDATAAPPASTAVMLMASPLATEKVTAWPIFRGGPVRTVWNWTLAAVPFCERYATTPPEW